MVKYNVEFLMENYIPWAEWMEEYEDYFMVCVDLIAEFDNEADAKAFVAANKDRAEFAEGDNYGVELAVRRSDMDGMVGGFPSRLRAQCA